MNRFVLALALAFGLGAVTTEAAFAAKPAAQEDPYAVPEMKVTGIADFDSFFAKGKAPLQSLADARKQVDMARGRINTALGLGSDVTFKDAFAELSKRLDKKATLAIEGGRMPKLKASDAVPADLQKMIDEFNGAMTDLEAAFTSVEGLKGELTTLATAAAELPGKTPDAVKAAGLPAKDALTVPKTVAGNVKVISTAKDQSSALFDSLTAVVTDAKAAFGG